MNGPAKSSHQTKHRAKEATRAGAAVRDRIRELTLAAFRDRALSLGDIPKLVREVLAGAAEGVDACIPATRRNVLRGVFAGLREGVHSLASAGTQVMRDAGTRGQTIAGPNARSAAKRIRAANEELFDAVGGFAAKASKQVREGLDEFVAQARRTAPAVADSAQQVAKAADGRLLELTGETASTGVRVARRAAGAMAMGAGGFFEGLAEVISPKEPVARARKPAKARNKRVKIAKQKKLSEQSAQ